MKFTELNLKELRNVCREKAQTIKEKEDIDLIIYVAKAGLPIAVYMNEIFDVKMIGIGAQRKGNETKGKLGKIMRYVPRFVRDMLIAIELKTKVHKKSEERNVCFHDSVNDIDTSIYKKILVIDDSVDTGHSMKKCVEAIEERFKNAQILSYSLNVWKQSEEIFVTDYYSYIDTVIKAPMSKDSKEYDEFIKMYEIETKEGYI